MGAQTLYGPKKNVQLEIKKIIANEEFMAKGFDEHDVKTACISYTMNMIQKQNYGLWIKIFMQCVENCFQERSCIYPPNWVDVKRWYPDLLKQLPESEKYTCINDDRLEIQKRENAVSTKVEMDNAIFMTESGKFFCVSYNTLLNNYASNDSITKYELKLEKKYYLKKSNVKANICMAHRIDWDFFKTILKDLGLQMYYPENMECRAKKIDSGEMECRQVANTARELNFLLKTYANEHCEVKNKIAALIAEMLDGNAVQTGRQKYGWILKSFYNIYKPRNDRPEESRHIFVLGVDGKVREYWAEYVSCDYEEKRIIGNIYSDDFLREFDFYAYYCTKYNEGNGVADCIDTWKYGIQNPELRYGNQNLQKKYKKGFGLYNVLNEIANSKAAPILIDRPIV